ncbi:WXG100 family type VII secretion target [Actinomadura violacea]|nr:WXG100 family type VII secretion target [Actinomadura violacea]
MLPGQAARRRPTAPAARRHRLANGGDTVGGQSAVDRHAMQQAATRIEDSANIVKGLQSQLEGHKSSLMSGWAGNAAVSFDRVFNEFQTEMNKVRTALDGMHQKLTHTKITYESTEQEQTEAVNKINQLLNGST